MTAENDGLGDLAQGTQGVQPSMKNRPLSQLTRNSLGSAASSTELHKRLSNRRGSVDSFPQLPLIEKIGRRVTEGV